MSVLASLSLVLGSIPSPSSGSISVGPLELRAYGLMIALGVIAAVWLAQRRWAEAGGDPEDVASIAMWAVPAGLIGARIYHVLTDWKVYQGRWVDAVKIWEGGLGIPGGIALGTLVGLWVARRKGIRLPVILDAAAPALPLAQAIGRWGNWFNQELFGGPTDLPWGLEIDPERRPGRFVAHETFHPTFLYESLWNLALCGALIWVGRTGRLRSGRLFALYVLGYFVARLGIELMRSDPASLVAGVRINVWISLLGIAVGGWFVARGGRRPSDEVDLRPYHHEVVAAGGADVVDVTEDDDDTVDAAERVAAVMPATLADPIAPSSDALFAPAQPAPDAGTEDEAKEPVPEPVADTDPDAEAQLPVVDPPPDDRGPSAG